MSRPLDALDECEAGEVLASMVDEVMSDVFPDPSTAVCIGDMLGGKREVFDFFAQGLARRGFAIVRVEP